MKPVTQAGLGALLLVLSGTAGFSQQAISARSGMVHYHEGDVFAGDQKLEDKVATFTQVKENQILRTAEGRAEVLLTPGVFARVGENSSFRMITNRLVDTRLEFLTGSMIMESDDMLKDNAVTVVASDAVVHLRKTGIYRFDSEPPSLRVLKGAVDIEAKGKTFELKEGKLLNLAGEMAMEKFDPKATDALARWSYRRAEYVAMANVSAAKSLSDSGGYVGTGLSGGYPCLNTRSSLWAYNPYFGMYTYIPCGGRYSSPYGFVFWSPATVYRVYAPRPVYNPNWGNDGGFSASHGYGAMAPTSGGYSGSVASSSSAGVSSAAPAPSAAAAPAATGGVSHAGGGGGGHR
jgi:hypothetical protein